MALLGWLFWLLGQLLQIALLLFAIWLTWLLLKLLFWPFRASMREHPTPAVRMFAAVYCGLVLMAAIGGIGILAVELDS